MVDLKRVKAGDVLVGEAEKGIDNRLFQPVYRVTKIDLEKGYLMVKNRQGQNQIMGIGSLEHLYTVEANLRYLWGKISAAWREIKKSRETEGY